MACFVILWLPMVVLGQEAVPVSRHRIKALAEVPLQIGVGYDFQVTRRFSAGIQAGYLSDPNSSLILLTLEKLGTDKDIVLMIDDAFHSGLVLEGGVNYHFGNNYCGFFLQHVGLVGKDTPKDLVEGVMGVDLSSFPSFPGRRDRTDRTITLKSDLLQLGFLYGRRIPFRDKRSEINLEFGISKNISSQSSVSSSNRNLATLSRLVNNYLTPIYSDYVYVPSLTVAYVYKFGKAN
jgi:hypothetical protein